MRVLAYNAHLFGKGMPWLVRLCQTLFVKDPTCFKDPLRAQLIAERIRAMGQGPHRLDVVGLCEVWDENLAHAIHNHVREFFPYVFRPAMFQMPGDKLGSGLTLLSRYPFAASAHNPDFSAYGAETGCFEKWSQKGYACAIIEMPGGIHAAFFLTHAQSGQGRKKERVRKMQFCQLARSIRAVKETYPEALLVACGDFNVIGETKTGEETDEYRTMLATLQLQDTFRANHTFADDPGFTSDATNRLLKKFDRENRDKERLDYILCENNPRIRIIDSGVEEFRLDEPLPGTSGKKAVYHLSDHYGVWTEFELG